MGYLLNKCIIPIGLYRGVNPVLLVGMQENSQPFVSTNPPPDTVIDTHLDKVLSTFHYKNAEWTKHEAYHVLFDAEARSKHIWSGGFVLLG